jgi:ketosteroid isomerase-like protein
MSKAHKITDPSQSNATFAKIFNEGKNMDAWLSLYEPDAILLGGPQPAKGHDAIRQALTELAKAPGELHSRVNFHEVNGDIALTRADYQLVHEGKVLQEGGAIEVLRRQHDGRWLFIIDNPVGASIPSVFADESKKDD